jgi:hypothetical protein
VAPPTGPLACSEVIWNDGPLEHRLEDRETLGNVTVLNCENKPLRWLNPIDIYCWFGGRLYA